MKRKFVIGLILVLGLLAPDATSIALRIRKQVSGNGGVGGFFGNGGHGGDGGNGGSAGVSGTGTDVVGGDGGNGGNAIYSDLVVQQLSFFTGSLRVPFSLFQTPHVMSFLPFFCFSRAPLAFIWHSEQIRK